MATARQAPLRPLLRWRAKSQRLVHSRTTETKGASPSAPPITAVFGGADAARPTHAYQIHVYHATAPFDGSGRRGVLAPPTRHRRASIGQGLAIRRSAFTFGSVPKMDRV